MIDALTTGPYGSSIFGPILGATATQEIVPAGTRCLFDGLLYPGGTQDNQRRIVAVETATGVTRTSLADGAVVGPAGATYDLESPGSNLPALLVGDEIRIFGFAGATKNGLFSVTVVNTSLQDYTVERVDGQAVGAAAEAGVAIDVDENPENLLANFDVNGNLMASKITGTSHNTGGVGHISIPSNDGLRVVKEVVTLGVICHVLYRTGNP